MSHARTIKQIFKRMSVAFTAPAENENWGKFPRFSVWVWALCVMFFFLFPACRFCGSFGCSYFCSRCWWMCRKDVNNLYIHTAGNLRVTLIDCQPHTHTRARTNRHTQTCGWNLDHSSSLAGVRCLGPVDVWRKNESIKLCDARTMLVTHNPSWEDQRTTLAIKERKTVSSKCRQVETTLLHLLLLCCIFCRYRKKKSQI